MRRLATALLSLLCCAHVPDSQECRTACGLSAAGNCAQLQALEDAVVRNFARYVDSYTEPQVCGALFGWRLVVHQRKPSDVACRTPEAWRLSAGFCVLGYTRVEQRQVELPDTNWATNAAAHELVHVVDFTARGRAGHCRWKARGVTAALRAINVGAPEELGDPYCD